MISDYDLRIAATEAAKALVAAAEALEDDGEQCLSTPEWEHKLRLWDMWWDLRHALRHVAAACLVAALGLTGWLTVDAQAREAFTGWVREVCELYVAYRPGTSDEKVPVSGEKHHYRLGWIPDGYTEIRQRRMQNGGNVLYSDSAGRYLSFQYSWGENSFLLLGDTGRMTRSYANVDGIPADLWTSDDLDISPALVWTDENGTNFYLSGFLDVENLLRLAETIEVEK